MDWKEIPTNILLVDAMATSFRFVLQYEYKSSEHCGLVDFPNSQYLQRHNCLFNWYVEYVAQSQHNLELDRSPTCNATDQLAPSPTQERTVTLSNYIGQSTMSR